MTLRVSLRSLIVVTLVGGSLGCSEVFDANRDISETIEDASISSEVARRLENHPEGRAFSRVNVDTERALVYLSGSVPSGQAEQLAIALARDVSGVRGVRSDLIVDDARGDTRRVDDDQIAAEVKWRLANDRAHASFTGVEVSSRRGAVTLTGRVPDDTAKRRAYQLASDTDGVTRVIDRLEASPKVKKNPKDLTREDWDALIQLAVLQALAKDNRSAYTDVTAQTRAQTVYLAGTVDSAARKARAASVAREVEGVKQVVNRLQVEQK